MSLGPNTHTHERLGIRHVGLIIKVISSCNLACRYCDADIYSNKRMGEEVLRNLMVKAFAEFDHVNFIWHGGEPLLRGIDFYREALRMERELSNGKRYTNSIQTNGTLLNKEWVEFLLKNNFGVGVSLDGPPELHDANRVYAKGPGSHAKVMDGLRLAEQQGLRTGVLAVVTEDTLRVDPERFLDFFIENGITKIGLNWQRPRFNRGETHGLRRSRYEEYINRLFDVWYGSKADKLEIREFRSIMRALMGGKQDFCILAGKCIGKYFGISPEGDVYHCDEFMFHESYKLGNILENDFKQILASHKLLEMREYNQRQIDALNCKWKNVCNGGCPKDRFVLGHYDHSVATVDCCGWSTIIEHISQRLSDSIAKVAGVAPNG